MIADEIVHNSIPEDRIQFATTCKAFNQLVKHAKPKKIIRYLRIHCDFTDVSFRTNSQNERIMTLPELKKILQQCQVEDLSLYGRNNILDSLFSELMDLLVEPCRFVTALGIRYFIPEFKFVDFYTKLKHLKFLKIYDASETVIDLPYFPPKLLIQNEYTLPLLAERTLNRPLSFLKVNKAVQLTDIQQFLMAANLEIGAEIHFHFENQSPTLSGFLTFIGNGLFEFQILRESDYLILDQQMSSQNKKILKLLTDFCCGNEKIPFTVTSVSNPDFVVHSGIFTDESRYKIVFENVAECIKISNPNYSIHYSALLDDWFPRTENYDPFERVKTINKTLGTNIVIIKPEMLEEKFIFDQCLPKRTARKTQHFQNLT
uniref:F-box domain-containing protein n=1 Tax=Panagrolaimus sp. JU765 TaxID=591449 RepID=A0AC34RTD7_9BILA